MNPPRLARALVRLLADANDRRYLLEDLDDRFRTLAETRGPRVARRWYWSQALSAVPWALRRGGGPTSGRPPGWRSWQGLSGDLRLGLRTLVRHPLYASGVAGTLCVGLAAATLAFVVAWEVWLAPLPIPDPDRVVRLYEMDPRAPGGAAGGAGPSAAASAGIRVSNRHLLSATLLEDLHEHAWRTLEGISFVGRPRRSWLRDGESRTISTLELSPEGFDILGIVPLLGRLPSGSEPGEGSEILLTERFWRTAFGADPGVLGSEMTIYGPRSLPVVGVARLPSGYPGEADIVRVLGWGFSGSDDRAFRSQEVIARVRPGHSVAAAEAELNAFLAALAEVHPEHRGWGMGAVVLGDDLVRPFRGVLVLLLAAGATFLLLAAVNVAGLVIARRVEGRHDRSIRLALGASEGRLLRGSLVESLLLTLAGAAAGVAVARWLVGPLRGLVPLDVPRLDDVAVGAPLALGGLGLGVLLGVLVGFSGYLATRGAKPDVGRAPAWRAVGVGGRRALVVGQVALTTLLAAGAAAVVQRASGLAAIDLGYEPEGVSSTSTVLRDVPRNRHPAARWTFARTVLDGLEERGLVAAIAFNTPMRAEDLPQLGMRPDSATQEIVYDLHLVSPGYFSVMGVELLAGRDFGPEDRASSQRVVIVSETFVDRYFGAGTDPGRVLGRALTPLIYETEGPRVVGVVESTRHRSPEAPVQPEVYSPLAQLAVDPMTLLVRGEPEQVAEAVAAVVAQVDPQQRWTPLVPYTSHLREWYAPLRLQIVTVGVLGALGLLLASLGVYSLMAYQVSVRRQELGVRKALGAQDRSLVLNVVSHGVGLAAVGAAVGLAAWYRLVPAAADVVEGIDAAGAVVPVSATLVVGVSCLVATFVPALRATQVDPVVTLKAD